MMPISYLALEFLRVLNVDKEPPICVHGMVPCALPVALVKKQDIKRIERKKMCLQQVKSFLHLNQILLAP